jgi:carnitine O-acetyltransferase
MININWWCLFIDHPKHDRLVLKKPPPKGVFTDFQINRAAGLITNFMNFKQFVDEYVPFLSKI